MLGVLFQWSLEVGLGGVGNRVFPHATNKIVHCIIVYKKNNLLFYQKLGKILCFFSIKLNVMWVVNHCVHHGFSKPLH